LIICELDVIPIQYLMFDKPHKMQSNEGPNHIHHCLVK
jgi:hypothetical protein